MNKTEFTAITFIQGAIGFGFASQWFKSWREIVKQITKRSNTNRVTTFPFSFKNCSVLQSIEVK